MSASRTLNLTTGHFKLTYSDQTPTVTSAATQISTWQLYLYNWFIQVVHLLNYCSVALLLLQAADHFTPVWCVCSLWWGSGSADCVGYAHFRAWFEYQHVPRALEVLGCTEEGLTEDGDQWALIRLCCYSRTGSSGIVDRQKQCSDIPFQLCIAAVSGTMHRKRMRLAAPPAASSNRKGIIPQDIIIPKDGHSRDQNFDLVHVMFGQPVAKLYPEVSSVAHRLLISTALTFASVQLGMSRTALRPSTDSTWPRKQTSLTQNCSFFMHSLSFISLHLCIKAVRLAWIC